MFAIFFWGYALFDGAFAIASGLKARTNGSRWPLVLEGISSIAAGFVAVLWPAITLIELLWILAIWAIVSGALMLCAVPRFSLADSRRWMVLAGTASLVLGLLLIVVPLVGSLVLTQYVGAYALVFGALLLALAFQLHSLKEELERGPLLATETTA